MTTNKDFVKSQLKQAKPRVRFRIAKYSPKDTFINVCLPSNRITTALSNPVAHLCLVPLCLWLPTNWLTIKICKPQKSTTLSLWPTVHGGSMSFTEYSAMCLPSPHDNDHMMIQDQYFADDKIVGRQKGNSRPTVPYQATAELGSLVRAPNCTSGPDFMLL